jgi:hypothetical protein
MGIEQGDGAGLFQHAEDRFEARQGVVIKLAMQLGLQPLPQEGDAEDAEALAQIILQIVELGPVPSPADRLNSAPAKLTPSRRPRPLPVWAIAEEAPSRGMSTRPPAVNPDRAMPDTKLRRECFCMEFLYGDPCCVATHLAAIEGAQPPRYRDRM